MLAHTIGSVGLTVSLVYRRSRMLRGAAPPRAAAAAASSGDATFDAAAAWFGSCVGGLGATTAEQLRFYGLFKQASGATCPSSGPGLLEMERRAKWASWRDVAHVDPAEARRLYVARLDALAPTWRAADPATATAAYAAPRPKRIAAMGPTQSTLAMSDGPAPESDEEEEDPIYEAASEGDVATVRAWLDGSGGGDPSKRRGWDGSTLLHCAADALSDNVALVELLIEAGVSIDGRNDDGATALLCAAMAEHRGVVALLLAAGADPLIEDNEGQCAAAQEGFVASYS